MTDALSDLVARALAEDVGAGTRPPRRWSRPRPRARARIVQKAPGVLFGLDAAEEAFRQAGAESFDRIVVEGQWRDGVPAQVALVTGPARALLAGERTALNLLGHLSGVATLTARFVAGGRGHAARAILDTRKTTPGLRALEKAAVAAGGGRNHRMGLYDAILIKENHAALAGGVGEAVRLAAERRPDLEAEVECRDLDEVREALAAGARRLLLDNMDPDGLRAAVAARDEAAADGDRRRSRHRAGVTLENVREIAATGVDFISVGALTHSAPALDVSLLMEQAVSDPAENVGDRRARLRAWARRGHRRAALVDARRGRVAPAARRRPSPARSAGPTRSSASPRSYMESFGEFMPVPDRVLAGAWGSMDPIHWPVCAEKRKLATTATLTYPYRMRSIPSDSRSLRHRCVRESFRKGVKRWMGPTTSVGKKNR